jgi:aconitate hydratase 2 / 2-methylisocitrate dehydratase
MSAFARFLEEYRKGAASREKMGIPPLPLTAAQVASLCRILADPALTSGDGRKARDLLSSRVTPGVTDAAEEKSAWLAKVAREEFTSAAITPADAVEMLGQMGGGANLPPLVRALEEGGELGDRAARALGHSILVGPDIFDRVAALALAGVPCARETVRLWSEAAWFSSRAPFPQKARYAVLRAAGEINTDFFSPAQEAGTRDDIPLHALSFLSTSPHDRDFIARARALSAGTGLPLLFAGDVVGTGSSRKSASNSLVWWIGSDIPGVPNKRRGGVVLASKIAPIFFNTLRGCGALPLRCPTGELREGEVVELDHAGGVTEGTVTRVSDGAVLTRFSLTPSSLLDEARAGGRNLLIIGRKLTARARELAPRLSLSPDAPPFPLPSVRDPGIAPKARFTLAQKLVGAAAGMPGVFPGEYVEPRASVVFSQDTTGRMTQQELEELACRRFATIFIQSFCHTAASPRSRDARMQFDLAAFVGRLGGIALRPGDGIIHTVGNRFLLPHFVGTGGDSHTRFPIGISFPAGSDMVAFAASQGYLPLDMPESVLVRFFGSPLPGITTRDLVHAIPWSAMRQGKLNLEKGDRKVNCFADRILEIEGLPGLTVEDSFRFTDASAERSAAAAVFRHDPSMVVDFVRANLAFLKGPFAARNASPQVATVIGLMEEWLSSPSFPAADPGAAYAEVVEVDLAQVTEPLLAAPNDPDRIVTLSEAAGTKVDEVFLGSCMVDRSDFLAAAKILSGGIVPADLRFWAVPPDRESASALALEGVSSRLLASGANLHVPGCSLCMGNQAQVASGATVVSTSTRNFDNRMGTGAQVFLASSSVAAITALLGRIPTLEEYQAHGRV